MDDLIAFVKARLDEAQRDAEAMGHDRDWDDDYRSCLVARIGTMADKGYGEADCNCGLAERKPRALREVEAKRQRLALYLAARTSLAAALRGVPAFDGPAVAHSYVRERGNVNQASGRFAAFEMSVRLDAGTWCDHPDYRPEWKP